MPASWRPPGKHLEWNTLGLLFVAGGRTHTTEDHGVSKKERVGKDLDSG